MISVSLRPFTSSSNTHIGISCTKSPVSFFTLLPTTFAMALPLQCENTTLAMALPLQCENTTFAMALSLQCENTTFAMALHLQCENTTFAIALPLQCENTTFPIWHFTYNVKTQPLLYASVKIRCNFYHCIKLYTCISYIVCFKTLISFAGDGLKLCLHVPENILALPLTEILHWHDIWSKNRQKIALCCNISKMMFFQL